jgi:hypothetical protein
VDAVLAVALDDQNLVRALEILVVALVWLFFLRIIRAVWVEVRPPRREGVAPVTRGGQGAALDGSRERGRRRYRLRVVEPPERRGETLELPDEVTLGRAPGCGIRLEDPYTSSLHARISRRDQTLWIEDLGSTNGTWVNAVRVTGPTKLGRGDLVQVGGTVFEVQR